MTAKEMADELRLRTKLIREAAAKAYSHLNHDCTIIESVADELDPPIVPAKPDGQITTTGGNSRKERKG